MVFTMNPETNEALFQFEQGDAHEKAMRLVFDLKNNRTEKFEKDRENKTKENAFAKAMSDKILEILPLAAIELARQESEKDKGNIEDLKSML